MHPGAAAVAFVQMLKALAPVSTMLWAFMFKLERPNIPLVSSVSLITAGVMGASLGELNFNICGVISMVVSVAAEGMRLVLMQYVLSKQQMHPLEALLYVAPACLVWLSVAVFMFESRTMGQNAAWEIVADNPWYFVVSACIGIALNCLAMAVIKLASALALKVLGVCKDVGLVAVSVVAYGEKVSALQVMGYCASVVGFSWYNHIKLRRIHHDYKPPLYQYTTPKDFKGTWGRIQQLLISKTRVFGYISAADLKQ